MATKKESTKKNALKNVEIQEVKEGNVIKLVLPDMAFTRIKYRLTGITPLLMNNGEQCDTSLPYNKELKKISKKRTKTDQDENEVSRLQWLGSLYLENERIVLPSDNILAMLRDKLEKTKAVVGIRCEEEFLPVDIGEEYTDPETLYNEGNYTFRKPVVIKNGTKKSRVPRTRPMFPNWKVEVELLVNTGLFNIKQINEALVNAGFYTGLCDWHGKFGRFAVEIILE